VLKLFTVSFCASLQSQCEAFNSLVDRFLYQAVPDHLQRFSDMQRGFDGVLYNL